jgi:hypothetical protein
VDPLSARVYHMEFDPPPEKDAGLMERLQVRLCRFTGVSPTGDLGYRGVRGAVGLGHRFTVYKRTLPPAPSRGVVRFNSRVC